ncbi:MAG: trypsin-like peptidase domain-containing protein [Gammaproteobacteria bacterium]|nr:trypsin-like peptidase domain-containing protein [Gammaproteobacteria bacterium]
MAETTKSKSKEYVENHFSTLNAHADSVIDNEKQLSRLKRFKADRVWIKNAGIVLLILGVFAILLAIAYNRYKAPVFQVVDKPVYIDKPVYNTIKVPDPKLSRVIEKPIYITKIIKVPIQITKREGVAQSFTFFNTKKVRKDGINNVVVGARYDSVNSPYPEEQWCYATAIKPLGDNVIPDVTLAKKNGLRAVKYKDITVKDAKVFGATQSALKNAKEQCEFFPNVPPIEERSGVENTPPSETYPSDPPSSGGKSGTGFYVNKNGFVVTNNHVVSGCSSVWIKDNDRNIPGVVVKNDEVLDIAVIKANLKNKIFAKFADNIRTGEDVMALGFPLGSKLGDDIKVTKGNISAVSGMKGDKDYLQFTAPIQAGNSGGPLLNEGGFVVGINTSKLEGKEYQNINFAINGNSAQRFLGRHSVDFEYGTYEESLKSADLAEKGAQFTVRVLCSN